MVSDPEQSQLKRDREPVAELRLRTERPSVTRLSRKVLIGLASIAAIIVSGALIWALYQGNRKPGGGPELYNIENKTTPDGLSALPRDYTGVPRNSSIELGAPPLGPPLPGDLGRPMLNAQVVPGPGAPAVDPEQQRVTQESEAARTRHLFATISNRERPPTPAPLPAPSDQRAVTPTEKADAPPVDPDSILNMQDRKLAFLNGPVDRKTISPDRLTNPASRYVVQAGRVIAAALITGSIES